MGQILILRDARSFFLGKEMKLILDAEDRKLFTRVLSPEKFGLRKYSLRKT